jgi:hypothetical protein
VFDIVGVGSTDVVLVQVKTRDWPGSVESEAIGMFAAPMNCRKLVQQMESTTENAGCSRGIKKATLKLSDLSAALERLRGRLCGCFVVVQLRDGEWQPALYIVGR